MALRNRGKDARGAQIRKSTLGTSNEISFSVLDAASSRSGRSQKRRGKGAWQSFDQDAAAPGVPLAPPPGEISLFTMGTDGRPPSTPRKDQGLTLPSGEFVPTGPRGGSAVMAVNEVAARKKSRRRARMVGVLASVMVLLALVAGFTSLIASLVNAQNTQQSQLVGLVKELETTDPVLLSMDEAVLAVTSGQAPDEETLSSIDDLLEQGSAGVLATLDQVKQKTQDLEERLMSGTDREVANNCIASVNARSAMIETGFAILQTAAPLCQAKEEAHLGWQALGQAENFSRQAADVLATMNTETVQQSKDYSQQALDQLYQARDYFARAAEYSEAVDLAAYTDYLQLKINASAAAIEADDAYLDRDKELMEERNAASNDYEAQAAEALTLSDANPEPLYDQVLTDDTAQPLLNYQVERGNVSVADEWLRNFLG